MNQKNPLALYWYYGTWFLSQWFGCKKPLINTMIITSECNLRCEHCALYGDADKGIPRLQLSWNMIQTKLLEWYKKGARIAYFEGGEPTLWKDGDKTLTDVIELAKQIGYFSTGYTTNGTQPLVENSDVISVSLDGLEPIHDAIRGKGVFQSLLRQLQSSQHPNIFANITLSRTNLDHFTPLVESLSLIPAISGIMFNFVTPPPSQNQLSGEEKKIALDKIMQLKKKGHRIVNTWTSLRALKQENWEKRCPAWMSVFVLPDESETTGCPMKSTESCQSCGFDAVREYYYISRGHPAVILGLLRFQH